MISNIGIVHISPKTDCTGEILPHSLIFPYALFAFLYKGLQTVFLNLILTVNAKKLLNLYLYRKTMGIPSGLSGHHIPLHGAVSGYHILYDTGKHMTDMRLAVRRRRSVVKCISRTAFPLLYALFEDLILFPEAFDLLFPFHKIKIRRYLCVMHFLIFLLP